MPFYDKDDQLIEEPQKLGPQAVPNVEEAPDFTETLGAAFRRENIVGSLIASETQFENSTSKEPNYSVWDDIKGTQYEDHWERFADVHNSQYSTLLKRQIDRETEDKRTLEAAGSIGFVSEIAAGVIDIPSLIPGGAAIRAGGKGLSIARSALSVGVAGGIDATATELALQGSQQTRGLDESAINIGSGIVLSSLLGAGVAKAMQRSELDRLKASLESDLVKPETTVDDMADAYDNLIANEGQSVGAAKVQNLSSEDLEIKGKAAKALGDVAFFNPMIQLTRSTSKAAKSVAANLPEMGFALKMTGRGESQPQAVETFVKQWQLGAVGNALHKMDGIFSTYRKGGGDLDKLEFRKRVARAMRRNDLDPEGNDAVTQTAKLWRETLFEPLKEAAIEAKLLPEDVDVSTAMSYFTRIYNKEKIIAKEGQFRGILNGHFRKMVSDLEARGEAEFANKADFDDYVDEAVTNTLNKILGREANDSVYNIVPMARGPLKERTLNISDYEIEEFLEDDIELVGRQYARTMSADVELTRKFGRADMQDQLDEVARDYEKLRKKIDSDKRLTEETREKRLKQLNEAEKLDIKNIEGLRDRLRGTYLLDQNTGNAGRVIQAVNTFNYLRAMGGVTLSSVGDVGRHVMVHGFTGVLRDGLIPLITNLKAVKLTAAEGRLAGSPAELINNTRMATQAELIDPYSYSHPVERWMNNAATGFSKLSGMAYWNQFQKDFSSTIIQNRIFRNAEQARLKGFDSLPKKEQHYMAFLGLGRGDAEKVGGVFAKYGEKSKGTFIANSEKWGATDAEGFAKRIFYAALNKDVDSTIVTKGIGDTPLFADSNLGRVLLQFKSFALASHQRVLMRAAQDAEDAPLAVLSGMTTQIVIGALIYYLKSIESGREVSDNPGKWIAEGFDKSGLFATFMEFNNIAEKVGAPGLYSLAQAAFPEKDQSAPASRYAIRSTVGSLLGPSFGLANDMTQMLGVGAGNLSYLAGLREDQPNITKGDISAMRRLMPGSTLPIVRSLTEYYGIPALEEALVK